MMGYTRDSEHNLVIVPEEAKIVRRIFLEYLQGKTTNQIAKGLMDDEILSPTGNKRWHESTVYSMLKNEKYMGCALMMKSYMPDVLSKKRIKNNGQCEQFYAENTHPAIIEKSMFMKVQNEMQRRRNIREANPYGRGKVSTKYPFSQMIRCGCCGAQYVRGKIYTSDGLIPAWWCYSRKKVKSYAHKKEYLKN